MENEDRYPKRKNPRLKGYDYSECGYYFVTICTKVRGLNILCHISPNTAFVGADAHIGPDAWTEDTAVVHLTPAGETVKRYIENMSDLHKGVKLETYIIMPDHVHLIISLQPPEDGPMWASAPTGGISGVIRSLKILSTKQIGESIWERSFYDRILRRDEDLERLSQYIAQNPARWLIKHPEGHDTNA